MKEQRIRVWPHYAIVAGLLLMTGPTAAADSDERRSPLSGSGLVGGESPAYTQEELEELDALERTVRRFAEHAEEYREAARKLIEQKYTAKRDLLFNYYEEHVKSLEEEQAALRGSAIGRFESFVDNYPDDPVYTPDAMFRLSELYFERSYLAYLDDQESYEERIDSWTPDSEEPEPPEPQFHYEPTIAMMQRLVTEYPGYRLVDGARYLLGYCLGEQGEDERAKDVYERLVADAPNSRFTAEVWTRIGEYYFNTSDLERAAAAYNKVLGHYDSPFYDKALYKLAWTHYRLADPERAPEEFQEAVDTFVALLDFNEKTKAEGQERGGELRKESVQYVAISFADEQWGGTDKLINYLDGLGPRPYSREIIKALGDVFFDQTRYQDAVQIYALVQDRYPDDPDAPVVQDQIVTALERDRNFEEAASARERLNLQYSEGGDWFTKNAENPDALAKAVELAQKALYSAALFFHRQAQIHKDSGKIDLAKEAYTKASNGYGDYLKRFPHDKQRYELSFYYADCLYYSLQFDSAAEQYGEVRDAGGGDKFLFDSALGVVLSLENAVKVATMEGRLAELPTGDAVSPETEGAEGAEGAEEEAKPKEIPALRMSLINASDRFAEMVQEDDNRPNILYKAAETYYSYGYRPEAEKRFKYLLEHYADHQVAEYATNLIIEIYLGRKDFQSVAQFTQDLLGQERIQARGDRVDALTTFRSGALFKIAEKLAADSKHEEASDMYVQLVDENPKNEFADLALNNAAVGYEKVKRYDSASKLYRRIVDEYPSSRLADGSLFRVALNAERFFDFAGAIGTYLKLIGNYPKSERRADAVYNAAFAMENVQDYERSAKEYLRYCKLFPDRDDAPEVCFRAGAVYEKMKDPRRVISTYRNFIKRYSKTDDHRDRIIEAYLRTAKAYEELGKARDVRKNYELVVEQFAKAPDTKAAPYAAEAKFTLLEGDVEAYGEIQFVGNQKKQQKLLLKKAETLKALEGKYKEIIQFKQIDWTLAALYRIGQLYQGFAESFINAECPSDIRKSAASLGLLEEEVCDEYKILLEEQAANTEDKAVAAYEVVVNRAREFQVANNWTKKTLVALNQLRRSEWPLQKDAKGFIDSKAIGPPPWVDAEGTPIKPEVKIDEPEPEPPAEEAAAPEAEAEQAGSEEGQSEATEAGAAEPAEAPAETQAVEPKTESDSVDSPAGVEAGSEASDETAEPGTEAPVEEKKPPEDADETEAGVEDSATEGAPDSNPESDETGAD